MFKSDLGQAGDHRRHCQVVEPTSPDATLQYDLRVRLANIVARRLPTYAACTDFSLSTAIMNMLQGLPDFLEDVLASLRENLGNSDTITAPAMPTIEQATITSLSTQDDSSQLRKSLDDTLLGRNYSLEGSDVLIACRDGSTVSFIRAHTDLICNCSGYFNRASKPENFKVQRTSYSELHTN